VNGDRTLAPFGRRPARVIAREQHGAYVVLRCLDPTGPRPDAGQFYMLATAARWGGGEAERPFLPRAFSVLRAPSGSDELHFLIEDVGPGTKRLTEATPGDELLIVGPLGRGFEAPSPDRRALLVGGGVGIAPLAIWQDQLEDPGIEPLLGFRDAPHAAGAQLLSDARVTTDDGSIGQHGFVTDLLREELLQRGDELAVYACGPPPMLEAVRALAAAHLVPAQLALESGMACGFGACFGCVVPTRRGYVRVCVDGPVLDAGALELVGGPGH
jgi:dihydroorotate dehydrogenase electron transfer subunit